MPRKSAPPKAAPTTSPVRELTFEDRLLTRAEAAQFLGVNENWVRRAITLRYFPHVKVGKLVRVRLSDLHAYVDAQRKGA